MLNQDNAEFGTIISVTALLWFENSPASLLSQINGQKLKLFPLGVCLQGIQGEGFLPWLFFSVFQQSTINSIQMKLHNKFSAKSAFSRKVVSGYLVF